MRLLAPLLLVAAAAVASSADGGAGQQSSDGGASASTSATAAAQRQAASARRTSAATAAAAAAATAAATATSGRHAWMRDYSSTEPWVQAAPTSQTLSIVLMTSHFFGAYASTVPCRPIRGAVPGTPGAWNLTCVYSEDRGAAEAADALWYHLPTTGTQGPFAGGTSFTARSDGSQLAVGLTMESAAYYPTMDDPAFMAGFGVDATYRRSADVQAMYWGDGYRSAWEARPPLHYASKQPAVAYLSSNCAAPSGRDAIVGRVMELLDAARGNGSTAAAAALPATDLRVDGLGACRRNTDAAAGYARMQAGELLRTYRFCVAIENSVAPDYVSEKVYAALAAGCTPIYLGAADIAAFIPTPSAVIDYRALGGTPEALAAELIRLNADPAAYAAHHAWRALPPAGWSPAFRALVARGSMEHTQCQICRRAAMHRARFAAGAVKGGGAAAGGAGVAKPAAPEPDAAAPAEAVQR